ncbi:MAG: glycosyltransferase family A protein [Pseudomonadota bacterium]
MAKTPDPAQVATRIAVIVCSAGRPECLRPFAERIALQTRQPDRLLFVVPRAEDAPPDIAHWAGPGVAAEVVISPKGLPRQRNHGLNAIAGDCGLVVFFDDDFLPSRHALARIAQAFAELPQVNGMTGHLIADGIRGPGIGVPEAVAMLARHDATPQDGPVQVRREGLAGLYGCNMAYRMAAIGAQRFDEALPLYGWQEDIDFAARIPGGRIKTDAFAGVHLGIKSGRETAGARLGYSQIVNPWYLVRKGTMRPRFALNLALRNMAANHWRGLRPEPWIDRLARARGNWIGLADILRGRADPGRILTL